MRFKDFIETNDLIAEIATIAVDLEIDPALVIEVLDEASMTSMASSDPGDAFWKSIGGKKSGSTKGGAETDIAKAFTALSDAVAKLSGQKDMSKISKRLEIMNHELTLIRGHVKGFKERESENPFELTKQAGQQVKKLDSQVEKKRKELLNKIEAVPAGPERKELMKKFKSGELENMPPTPSQAAGQVKKHPEVSKLAKELSVAKRAFTAAKRKLPGLRYKDPNKEDLNQSLKDLEYKEPSFPNSRTQRPGDVTLVPMDRPINKVGYMDNPSRQARQDLLNSLGVEPGKETLDMPQSRTDFLKSIGQEKELSNRRDVQNLRKGRTSEEDQDDAMSMYDNLPPWKRKIVDLQRKAIGNPYW